MGKKQEFNRNMSVKEQCRYYLCEYQRVCNSALSGNSEKIQWLGLSESRIKRRLKAHLNLLDIAYSTGEKYGLTRKKIDYEWARLCKQLEPNLDEAEEDFNLLTAAALWILNDLEQNGKMEDALKILPRNREVLDAVVIPELYSPCYSNDLIRSVVAVLAYRNADCAGIREVQRKPGEYAFSDSYSVEQLQHQDNDARNRYEYLISLLSTKAVEKADEQLQNEFLEAIDLYFDCFSILDADLRKWEKLTMELIKGMDGENRIMEDEIDLSPKLAVEVNKKKPSRILPIDNQFGLEMKLLSDAHEKLMRYNALTDKKSDILYDFPHDVICEGLRTKTAWEEIVPTRVAERITQFRVKDPYADCFALLCLADADDDYVWSSFVLPFIATRVAMQLPWSTGKNFEDLNKGRDRNKINTEYHFAKEPVLPALNVPVLIQKKADGREVYTTLGGLVYQNSSVVFPFQPVDMPALRNDLSNCGTKDDSIDGVTALTAMTVVAQHRVELPEQPEDDKKPQIDVSEYKRLKEELAATKELLHRAEKALRDEEQNHEAELSVHEKERQELHDLRELVFSLTNSVEETREEKSSVAFPYKVMKKHVVVGGHPNWLKVIKPMLPEVKFIDGIPSSEQIKGAQVIWLQTNYMSHTAYYKIIDIVRTNGIPLRYFTSASATKCAEQVVAADKANNCSV